MKTITVKHTSGSYQVIICRGIFDHLTGSELKTPVQTKKFFIIDQNAFKFHKKRILKFINRFGNDKYLLIPSGESSKSYHRLAEIYKNLLKEQYPRDSVVFAIGGGVTGDLAGFAASTYLRGIKIIHIPTTIIAAADSSIGGKTAINFIGFKNIIGSFYQPEMVVIDPVFFNSLPETVYQSGIGELIKYAFLDPRLFDDLLTNFDKVKQRDYEYLEKVILDCISFKAAVVHNDERENGLRKILNFGHTFGHGLESASGFKLPHGLAVHGGIISSLFLSYRLGLVSKRKLETLLALPLQLRPSSLIRKIPRGGIIRAMQKDKKSIQNEVRFILLTSPGELLIDVNAAEKEITGSIDDLKMCLERGRKLSGSK